MGFSSSDSITTVFLKLNSVILIKLLSNLRGAIHEGINIFAAHQLLLPTYCNFKQSWFEMQHCQLVGCLVRTDTEST